MNTEELSWVGREMTAEAGQDTGWPFVLFKNQRGATVNAAGE